MALMDQLRGFWRAFRRSGGSPSPDHDGHSLARTLRESTHVRGGHGVPRAGTEAQHKLVGEGHKNYTKSFDDDGPAG